MSLPTKGVLGSGTGLATKGIIFILVAGAIWQPIVNLVLEIVREVNLVIER